MNSPRASTPRRSQRGFTLIELLVVIGLIALLIGILLPAIGASREASRGSVCASNARQLQMANDLYASDFADCYAPGMPDRLANLTRWYGVRADPNAVFGSDGGPLSSYLGSGEVRESVRACPTFAPTLTILRDSSAGGTTSFEQGCGGYGYNTAFVGALRARGVSGEWSLVSDLSGMPRGRFVDPVTTASFGDAALRDASSPAGVYEYSFLEPRFWPEFLGQRPDPSVHFRHGRGGESGGRASIVWLDGHVSQEAMSYSSASGFYPGHPREMRIGWFGATDDNGLFDPD